MSNKHEQINDMRSAISKIIKKFLQDQEKQINNKNSNKNYSTENKLKKTPQQQTLVSGFKQQELYDELVNILDKLKKVKKRMNSINKIKKQKLNIFNPKMLSYISELQSIIQTRSVNVKIDKQIQFLIQQTIKSLTQADRILTLLQKQSSSFCCGKTQETKYIFYRAIINILGYGSVWKFIPKFTPLIQEKVDRIQIFTPIRIDVNQLDYQIEKQLEKNWPEPQIIEHSIQCNREHVDSQQEIEQKESAVSSLSQISQSKQKFTENIPQNYMKVEDVIKLKQDLEVQSQLREAQQKLFGFGRPQQIVSAIQIYKSIVQRKGQKKKYALNSLGQIYQEGKFDEIDRQKSEQYYRLSANLGDSEGLYKTGKYLQKGLLNTLNKKELSSKQKKREQFREAIQYYEKAASQDHLDAITDLGYIYEKGIKNSEINTNNVNRNESQVSQSSILTVKQDQFFIEPNFRYALKYYTKAKKFEFPRALNNLGALLIRQHEYIDEKVKGTNLQKGVKYLKKAAHLNYLKAFYNIGKCYQNGLGVEKNVAIAKRYYDRGSEKGDVSCKIQYIKHQLVNYTLPPENQDIKIAKMLQIIRQVLSQDPKNKECLYFLGLFFEKGEGVEKNPKLAYYYIHESAKQNYLPAITKMGDYKYSGFFVDKNIDQATKYYAKAADGGDPQAMINLSLMIEKGLIRSAKKPEKDAIQKLQRDALLKNNSNAFLIAGLKSVDFDMANVKSDNLQQKLLKSLQMGNYQTMHLLEKLNQGNEMHNKNIYPKSPKHMAEVTSPQKTLRNQMKKTQMAKMSNNMIKQGMVPEKTLRTNQLRKVKSSNNMKTN